MSVEVRILGLLEVADGPRRVELRRTKLRTLLALLVLRANEVVSAETLAEGLWGGNPPDSAANTLQTYVSQLRKALGTSVIGTRPPGYVLTVDPRQIDAVQFERLLEEGRAALPTDPERAAQVLDQALGLWRGPALADFTFETFASSEIARMEELRLVATEERMEAELALGRHDQLPGSLRRLVDEHPLRERFWGQLMIALYRSGRQAEALRTYSELRRTMRAELGIDPSSALQRLEEAMVLQEPHLEWAPRASLIPAPRVRSNLRLPRSAFVGRESELADLKEALQRPALVTVVGPPGVGKSRLAVEAARGLLENYPDGVWLAEVFAVADEARVPEVVMGAVGLGGEAQSSPMDDLTGSLRARRVLIVLDGCDHVLGSSAALVDTLLHSCPDVSVLVTSREPLRVDGEAVQRLAPMPIPQRDDVPPHDLVACESVRLFVEGAALADSDLVDPDNGAALARICRRLDGFPLALELAAPRARALGLRQLADRLDDALRMLTSRSRAGPVHHRSLRAAIDWSYDWLPERERVLFRRLSVFPGGFRLSDVEDVCADHVLDVNSMVGVISGLVDRSLIVRAGADGDEHYRMYETLRRYATEQLRAGGEEDAVKSRYAAWCGELGRR